MIPVVFDFDGTMCRLFRNYNLQQTSFILKDRMREYGVEFSPEKDAFDVFKVISQQLSAGEARLKAFRAADEILSAAEAQAVESCEPIKGFEEVFPQIVQDAGCTVGVATNNSAQCVRAFLRRFFIECSVPVVGRKPDMPERMKPNPWSVFEVSKEMRAAAKDVVFIGDTLNDYDCSRSAGCTFIGMAATAKESGQLSQFLPSDAIVNDFYALRDKLSFMLKSSL